MPAFVTTLTPSLPAFLGLYFVGAGLCCPRSFAVQTETETWNFHRAATQITHVLYNI